MITRKNFLIGAAATAATASAIDGESIDGNGLVTGRARGLVGGAFMGTLLAAQTRQGPYLGKNALEFTIDSATYGSTVQVYCYRRTGVSSYQIDWGDGTVETKSNNAMQTHTYSADGKYVVVVDDVLLCIGVAAYSRPTSGNAYTATKSLTGILALAADRQGHDTYYRRGFAYCDNLSTVTGFTTKTISSGAFLGIKNDNATLVFDISSVESVYDNSGGGLFDASTAVKEILAPRLVIIDYTNNNGVFKNCTNVTHIDLSSATSVPKQMGQYCNRLSALELGIITSWGSNALYSASTNAPLVGGIRLTVTVGNTMDSLMAVSGWSDNIYGDLPKRQIKFVCADGYITYDNNAWTKHST